MMFARLRLHSVNKHLNLGCGPGPLKGDNYLHVDGSRKLLISKIFFFLKFLNLETLNSWDKRVKYGIVQKLEFPASTFESVYSSHMLEHLYFEEAQTLLKKTFVWLKPGGIIRLALPDYDEILDEYFNERTTDPARAIRKLDEQLVCFESNKGSLTERLRKRVSGDLHIHKWHPNYAITELLLKNADFVEIGRKNFQEGSIASHFEIESRNSKTFYIEARKSNKVL